MFVALNSRSLQGSSLVDRCLCLGNFKVKKKDVGIIDNFICLSFVYLTCMFKACKTLAKHKITQINPPPRLCPRLC